METHKKYVVMAEFHLIVSVLALFYCHYDRAFWDVYNNIIDILGAFSIVG